MDNNTPDKGRIAKNTVLLYIRMSLVLFVGLYTSRVVLNTLGVSDYGVYNVVGGFVAMLSYLNAVFISTTQRFISFTLGEDNLKKLKTVFSSAVVIHYCIAIIIFLFAETVGLWFVNSKLQIDPNRMVAANWVYQCSVILLMFTIISVPYNACIIAHEHMHVYTYVSIVEVLLKLTAVVLLAYSPVDKLVTYAVALLIIAILVRFVYVIYCKKQFAECKFNFKYDKQLFREMFSYSGWSFFGTLGFSFKDQFSNVIMNLFLGTTINAARGICNQVTGTIEAFSNSILVAITPQITKQYAANNVEESKKLVYMGARLSFFLMTIIVVPCVINLDYLLKLWLITVPEYSSSFIKISLVIALIYSINSPASTAIEATGDIKKFQIGVSLIMLAELPLAYLFLKLQYPPYVALLPGILTMLVALIFRISLLKKIYSGYSFKYYLVNILLRGFIICLFCLAVSYFIKSLMGEEGIVVFLLSSLISVVLTSVVIYFVGLEDKERSFINRLVKTKLLKRNE